ncbi:PucR family transcriptional regulator [Mycolicibacterium brumae]|uniref:PucR family transcriptional regulator n=1 Tax=Mycolicibacterium brumae TaxID=85968 RepID=A0A2G5PF32_9MYCO|nr:helix-turn-helix domain-containing protein [Mycolicibacterium brumae]MCV7192083.1 helix-turn-helix domain-containing protein [Mycolicibacterium brumae]PIB76720.1 PucR family transcriptional regulator [Mycolicibacterium brumae]UWW07847.1 helix-turn-helix domain-containing protein [Mycolicibacterium brumae]
MRVSGVALAQLLQALDSTLVSVVRAPRGLDLPVASAALIDSDDVRLGLARSAESADVFFLVGVAGADALGWLDGQAATRVPTAIFVKEPPPELVARAGALGAAVVAVEPQARWERLYLFVNHVFDHHSNPADPRYDSGTDLFALAQSIADRTHGMVTVEDAQSHVLAYSASGDGADELRRLSILGRAGPPEHLRWLSQWGIFAAVRTEGEVVHVDERPELGLRPRRAVGILHPSPDARRAPRYDGTIWVQQGDRALADDTDDTLRGASVLAARIMARLAAAPSTHTVRVQELLGLRETPDPAETLARELGIPADGPGTVVGLQSATAHPRLGDILALSANAFHRDAQVAAQDSRVYVLIPGATKGVAVTSWARGVVHAMRAELDLDLRAVTGAVANMDGVAAARADIDRVLDSASRHPEQIERVTSLAAARTTVILDEIVSWVAANPRLADPRLAKLGAMLTETLRVYLDAFGEVATAAERLHVHPNTVRYRVRRIAKLLGASLDDPETRLLLALSLRAAG